MPQIRVKVMLVDVPLPDVSKSTAGRPATGVSKGDMGEIVAELKKRGGLRVGAQLQLLCGDNQAAFIQFGSRVPRVTGTSNSSRGRTIQTTRENIGTILGVTARVIEDDLVTLEIDLERSRLGPEEEGTPVATSDDGSVGLRAPQVETLTLQTTVSLRSGQTVLLGGMVFRTGERCGERLLLLHAEIVKVIVDVASVVGDLENLAVGAGCVVGSRYLGTGRRRAVGEGPRVVSQRTRLGPTAGGVERDRFATPGQVVRFAWQGRRQALEQKRLEQRR